MQMKHRLLRHRGPQIKYRPEIGVAELLHYALCSQQKHPADELGISRLQIIQRRNHPLGEDQNMHRRLAG